MPGFYSLAVGLGAALFILVLIRKVLKTGRNGQLPPLPPGPKGLPIVGNVNDLPRQGELEAKYWLRFKNLYGPISSVTVLGQTMVIVNDAKIAFELLEKRSAKYSSRPFQLFSGEMVGFGNMLGLVPYNDRFRRHRTNIAKTIGTRGPASQYQQLQEAESGHLLLRILDKPDGLFDHIQKLAGSVILKMTYGYNSEPFGSDYLVEAIAQVTHEFEKAVVPGAFMVDLFPWLRYLPEWFPGTGWKQTAKEWRAHLDAVIEKPFAFVKHQMAESKHDVDSSILGQLLSDEDQTAEDEFTAKWTALSLYTGGTDTTVSSVACFFLAMSVYPDVQRKAQAEIDEVIGRERLPTFSDRPNLPYVEAVVKEVLRWHPVAPMSLPHAASEDDTIEGYFIPKNALILTNIWHFTHDPDVYQSPEDFKPERFLSTEGRTPETDPQKFVFGFGRRICPGRILADDALFITVAQALSTLNIGKRVINGRVIEPNMKFSGGLVSHPEPFEASIRPRSPHHEELIRAIERTYPWQESNQEILARMRF